jgi:hypothetical protein
MSLYLGHQPRVRPVKSGDIVKEVRRFVTAWRGGGR